MHLLVLLTVIHLALFKALVLFFKFIYMYLPLIPDQVVQIQLEEGDKILSPVTEETNILQGVVKACLASLEGAALDQLQHLKLQDLLFKGEVLPPINPIEIQGVVLHQLVRVGDSAYHFREVLLPHFIFSFHLQLVCKIRK